MPCIFHCTVFAYDFTCIAKLGTPSTTCELYPEQLYGQMYNAFGEYTMPGSRRNCSVYIFIYTRADGTRPHVRTPLTWEFSDRIHHCVCSVHTCGAGWYTCWGSAPTLYYFARMIFRRVAGVFRG